MISLNGNTTVLAGEQSIRAAAILGCPVEVNIYYRTPERMNKLVSALEDIRVIVASSGAQQVGKDRWSDSVNAVEILGGDADGRIEGLEGPRASVVLAESR